MIIMDIIAKATVIVTIVIHRDYSKQHIQNKRGLMLLYILMIILIFCIIILMIVLDHDDYYGYYCECSYYCYYNYT